MFVETIVFRVVDDSHSALRIFGIGLIGSGFCEDDYVFIREFFPRNL